MRSFLNDPVSLTVIMEVYFLFLFLHPWTRRADKHQRCLERTAALEHDLDLLPHNDPDIRRVCKRTHLPKVDPGPAPGAKAGVSTVNEQRQVEMCQKAFKALRAESVD